MAPNQRTAIATNHRLINLKFFCTRGILATITAFSFSLISNFVRHEAEVGRSFETLAKTIGC